LKAKKTAPDAVNAWSKQALVALTAERTDVLVRFTAGAAWPDAQPNLLGWVESILVEMAARE
jgi:hypothetical protein